MSIFVTGGAGYIGSHFCRQLAQQQFKPICYDNLSTGVKQNVLYGPLIEGDLLDIEKLEYALETYKPLAVAHFASTLSVAESVSDPKKYYRNNVIGSYNLFYLMKKHGIKYCLFSSSAAVYGNPLHIPIPENHPTNPINPYGKSKLYVEEMLKDFGLCSAILRYFNVAGRTQQHRQNHHNLSHLIPIALEVASGRRPILYVNGTDYLTHDGTAIRDYIHVEDLAVGHILALKKLLSHSESFTINLGSGFGYSIYQIIQAIEGITCRPLAIQIAPRREGDPPALVADTSKAKSLINFSCRLSSITSIIKSVWAENRLFSA